MTVETFAHHRICKYLGSSGTCDNGRFISPKECALAPFLTEGCCLQLLNLLANRQYRQQLVVRNARLPPGFAVLPL